MSVDVGSAKGYLDLDISGFLSGLKTAQSEANSASKNIATTIGTNIQGIGKSLTSVGSTLTKNVTVPLAAVGVAGLKVATDFEKGMSQVKAISGATGKEFDALREKAIELGADTAFSAGEVAEAMTEMAKAGWNSQQIIDGMGGVLDAAAASGESLATVSTIVADAITGFGLAASDSSRIADLLTQAANSGTIGITDLGESFKYIAPVASAMGMSVEDVTTAISAMSMAGIKGSQAGTALRTMLTRMIKPNDNTAAAMAILGIEIKNADGSMKSLNEIVSILRTSFDGLTESEKAKYAATIAGQEGMAGMLSLLNLTEEEYNAIALSMQNADGVAKETATTMQDNLQSKLEQLLGALESLAIKLSDLVIPYLRQFVEWITKIIDKLTALDPETQKTILKFGALAIAAGPVITVAGKIVSGFGGIITTFGKIPGAVNMVKTGFTAAVTSLKNVGEAISLTKAGFPALGAEASKLGAAIGGITGPIAAVIAIIAVLVAAFVSLWKNNEEFRDNIIAIWNQIKETFNNFCQGIVDRINALGFDFENIAEVFKAIWEGLCNFLAPVFEGAFQLIADTFDFAVNNILAILDFFIALFTGDWEGVWESTKTFFENTWNYIGDFFQNIWNTITGILDVVCGWFGTTWDETWTGIKDFFVNIWNSISTFFTNVIGGIWEKIRPLFEEIAGAFQMAWDVIKLIWDYVEPYFTAIWEGIKAVFSVVVDWFKTVFSVAWEAIKGVWNVVVAWFTLIWESIKAVFSVVAEWFKGIFSVAWEAIKAVWNNVVNFFTMIWAGIKAVFAVVKGVLSGNFTDAWEAIKNLWNKVVDFFKGIWDGVKNVFSAVGDFFKNVFGAAWEAIKKIFNNFGSFFSSLWDTIKNTFSAIGTKIGSAIGDAVKKGINGVIGMIEGIVNTFVRMINGAIDLINLIPGVSIGYVNELAIPRLAKGAVLPPNSPFLAVVGDQKSGTNVEAPLSTIQEAVAEVIKSFAYDIISLQQAALSVLNGCYDELGYISYYGFRKPNEPQNKNKSNTKENAGGDTFNFYSPKAIDEIEAAKQIKRTKRDLAEGF